MANNHLPDGWGTGDISKPKSWDSKNADKNSNINTVNTPATPIEAPSVSTQEVQGKKQNQTDIVDNQQSKENISKSELPKNTKKEKHPKTVRLSTVILAILLTAVISFLIIFVLLYFNKDDNNHKEAENINNTVIATTEKPTENKTEGTTAEAETETETEIEEKSEEKTEYNTEYFDDIEADDEFIEYTTRLYKGLSYYQLPDYDSKINGKISKTTIYTIVDEKYDEAGYLWGKLKSGVGWVNLNDNDWLSESQD